MRGGGGGAMARLAVATRAFSASASAGAGGVAMVQGASRGIGLEFVRQLLRRSDQGRVVATCRAPGSAAELQKLKEEHAPGRLTVLPIDVTDEGTIEAAAASIGETHGSLDLLINSTGILSIPNVIQPETTLSKVQKSSLLLAYEVNAVGPILVIKHMWPLLKAGGRSETGRGFSLVANMSARVSSIGDNGLGGWHAYRASKTALNQLTKTVSVEFGRKDNIACILLHPGTVDTDLSRPFQKNVPKDKLFTREFSVQKLLSIIDNVKKSDNGKFFAWDGEEIPWICTRLFSDDPKEKSTTMIFERATEEGKNSVLAASKDHCSYRAQASVAELQNMDLFVVPLILLTAAAVPTTVANGGGRCNHWCNSFFVPYPFGFSGDCPILLACNATTSTPLLPDSSTGAAPYPILSFNSTASTFMPILSFNSTASTFMVALAPSCNRGVTLSGPRVINASVHGDFNTSFPGVVHAKASLSGGGGYGFTSHTGLFLRDGCRALLPSMSNCTVSADIMSMLLRTAQCGNDTAWTCVYTPPPPPNSSAALRGQGQFMMLDDVDAAGCVANLLTAIVYGDTQGEVPSMEVGVAELGWWLNGTCEDAAADGECAHNATCHDVKTPSGAWGHRCACSDGMTGDGFAGGVGCQYGGLHAKRQWPAVAAGVAAVALLIIGVPVLFCLWKRKRQKQNPTVKMLKATNQSSNGGARLFRGVPVDDIELEGVTGPHPFSYDELAAATGNFSDDRRLGRGGFGSVYAGFLTDGNHRDVAVKRVSETSRQGWKEFVSEVRIISRLRHRNLVQLLGWCHGGAGDGDLLLVYELMHNGSLDAHLYDPEGVLAWPARYATALGVGDALLYLHQEAERRVVHRDVKPSNVMLDASFTAKLGDFGLARLIDDGRRSHTTGVAGTMGYTKSDKGKFVLRMGWSRNLPLLTLAIVICSSQQHCSEQLD